MLVWNYNCKSYYAAYNENLVNAWAANFKIVNILDKYNLYVVFCDQQDGLSVMECMEKGEFDKIRFKR